MTIANIDTVVNSFDLIDAGSGQKLEYKKLIVNGKEVVIPSSAGGCPVARVYALFDGDFPGSVILPPTVRIIARNFVYDGGIHTTLKR